MRSGVSGSGNSLYDITMFPMGLIFSDWIVFVFLPRLVAYYQRGVSAFSPNQIRKSPASAKCIDRENVDMHKLFLFVSTHAVVCCQCAPYLFAGGNKPHLSLCGRQQAKPISLREATSNRGICRYFSYAQTRRRSPARMQKGMDVAVAVPKLSNQVAVWRIQQSPIRIIIFPVATFAIWVTLVVAFA